MSDRFRAHASARGAAVALAVLLPVLALAQAAVKPGLAGDHKQNPTQGAGVRTLITAPWVSVVRPIPPPGPMSPVAPAAAPSTTTAAVNANANANANITGTAPSMLPPGVASPAAAECTIVGLRRSPDRAHATLIDLTGDGLIASAVDSRLVDTALGVAGSAADGPVQRCIAPSVLRALLEPSPPAARAAPLALVQTDAGWLLGAPVEPAASLTPMPVDGAVVPPRRDAAAARSARPLRRSTAAPR